MDAELEEQLLKLSLINKTALVSSSSPSSLPAANIRHTTPYATTLPTTIESKNFMPTLDDKHITAGHVASLINSLREESVSATAQKYNTAGSTIYAADDDKSGIKIDNSSTSPRKTGPMVPPKPFKKKSNYAEIPKSSFVKQACEPLYSQRLQYLNNGADVTTAPPLMQKKPSFYSTQNRLYDSCNSKVTLDNPAILEQQLEALAHHKKQLERKGLLLQQQQQQQLKQEPNKLEQKQKLTPAVANISCIPKLSSTSLLATTSMPESNASNIIYTNIYATKPVVNKRTDPTEMLHCSNEYSNISIADTDDAKRETTATPPKVQLATTKQPSIYSNIIYAKENDDLTNLSLTPSCSTVAGVKYIKNANTDNDPDDDMPSPPSPVSSSYSELRRATDIFTKRASQQGASQVNEPYPIQHYNENVCSGNNENEGPKSAGNRQTYINMKYNSNDYSGYNSMLQGSSTYESIYEPINPRPPSQLSATRSTSNYLMYVPYVNSMQSKENNTISGTMSNSSSTNLSTYSATMSADDSPVYNCDSGGSNFKLNNGINYNHHSHHSEEHPQHQLQRQKETEVEALTDFLVHSMDSVTDVDSYGICFKCNERVLGENSGCTAMEQIYHIACFTCSQCQINLQGKPFYALDGKPYCEYDYLQTLEKCSICMKPILERILRATGKPYHPQCFTCVVCGNSLDGIPFTVDATNQNYCIADFHKKFAPRCCVCKEPIMPELGEEETVRVVALDRSFHFECYKCEDCGLLLSSEAEGRGCYPLDDHVLCKSCNAKRVQMLTNRMTTEL